MTITLAPPVAAGRRSRDELRDIAHRANARLTGTGTYPATAERVIEWAAGEFGERFCVTSSMADAGCWRTSSPRSSRVSRWYSWTPVCTSRRRCGCVTQVARTLPVRVISVTPDRTVGQQDGEFGPRLFSRDPNECCFMRKVEPLERALEPYDAWAAGLRRDEGPTRANTPLVGFEEPRGKVKIAPLAYWTEADVQAYIKRFNVPVNPLLEQGYTSIGCWPCTRRTAPGEDVRAGRWAMFEKTECGLHAS